MWGGLAGDALEPKTGRCQRSLFLSGREAGLPPIYFLLNMPDSAMPHAWLADHQPQTQQQQPSRLASPLP